MDRFTTAGYGQFYGNGIYRDISSRFLRVRHGISQVRLNQADYANKLVATIAGYIRPRTGFRLADIGGSAGLVALEFVKRFGIHATVVDPSPHETAAARESGLDTFTGSLEEWNPGKTFDLVLLCRSIEHVFDLRTALTRIRLLLNPGGLFYCDIADFIELCQLTGAAETVAKVDHCFWLCYDTAHTILRLTGFDVISMNLVFGLGQVGFLLRASEKQTIEPVQPNRVDEKLSVLLQIDREWREFGSVNRTWTDRLRGSAYRFKRRVQQTMSSEPMPSTGSIAK